MGEIMAVGQGEYLVMVLEEEYVGDKFTGLVMQDSASRKFVRYRFDSSNKKRFESDDL